MKKIRFTLLVLFLLCIGTSLIAQTKITLKGEVVDKDNQPVIGAAIVEKGTTNGTVSNIDGKFVLNVSTAKSTLRVSCIGYEKVEIAASSVAQTGRIKIQESSVALNEVVTIGYGVVKKNDATGSVTAIKPDKMNKGLTLNAQDMIVGKIAGVSVISDGGTPGGGSTILIRGGSSLSATNKPLIVIDGLAMDNEGIQGVANPLSAVNPNDIESFTVLKDASATAIYGSRASNGVIIITTKKGVKGTKARVTYDGNVSISSVKKTYDVLSADEFRKLINDRYPTNSKSDSTTKSYLGNANTDWQKEIFQDALSHDHNINIMGGLKNMPYRFSAGYTNQDGIVKTSNFERYTASINLSPSFFSNHLTMNLNAKGMLVKNRYADGVVGAAAAMDPTQPVTSDNPKFASYGGYFQWRALTGNTLATANPVATLFQKSNVANSRDLIGNAEFDYKVHFLPDLHLHLNLGMESSYGKQKLSVDTMALSDYPYGRTGWDEVYKTNTSLNYYMQYLKEIGKHRFDLMGGYEWQHFHRNGTGESYGKLTDLNKDGVIAPNEYYNYITTDIKAWATESYLVSFFGRFNYSYANKYLLTATLRNDRSSRFSAETRSALFPAFALAWKINEEDFLKEKNIFSDLKLRLGYGITGQQDLQNGDYPYMPVYTANKNGALYPFGDTYYPTSRPDAYNKLLRWEETTTYNAGLDFGMFNSRITGSLDYYFRETKDLINVAPVPAGTNFRNKVIQNIGSLENKGLEFSINAKVISMKDLTWEVGYNFTINRNKITKLTSGNSDGFTIPTGGPFQGFTQVNAVGQPSKSFYVYQQNYDANGKPIEESFVNRDSTDKVINMKDRYFYHSTNPDYTMGLFSKIIIKNFDLGISLRASVGNYMYNAVEAGNANTSTQGLWSDFFSNKPKASIDLGFTGKPTAYISDYFVQDASFIRCDNITVGYSFKNPSQFISSGRFYVAVQNPFIITKYKGLDPEISDGIDNNIYPRPMITVVGLSLNF